MFEAELGAGCCGDANYAAACETWPPIAPPNNLLEADKARSPGIRQGYAFIR